MWYDNFHRGGLAPTSVRQQMAHEALQIWSKRAHSQLNASKGWEQLSQGSRVGSLACMQRETPPQLPVGRRDHLHLRDLAVDDFGWDVKLVHHAQRDGASTGLQAAAQCIDVQPTLRACVPALGIFAKMRWFR